MVLALALSVLIGVALGLLGGGGSILTVPILVYVLDMDPKAAIATSLVVVGTTSLFAMIQHARAGNVQWRTGLLFGAAGMVGALLGGIVAGQISGRLLMILFSGMMIATSVAMFRGRKEPAPGSVPAAPHTGKILLDGVIVGLVTGLVGAGGGFLVVPALVLLGGLEMRQAVGTSLLVIAMKSFAGYLGHATHETIDLQLAAMISGAAIVGSIGGAMLATKVPAAALRKGFGVFVLVMAAFQLSQEL